MPLNVELDERIWSKNQVKRLKALLEPGPYEFFKLEEDLQIAETERNEMASRIEDYEKAQGKHKKEAKRQADDEYEAEVKELTDSLKEAYFRLNEIAERLKEKKAALILEVLQDLRPRSTKKNKSLDEQRWSDSPPWSK